LDALEPIDLTACIAGDALAWDRFVVAATPIIVAIARSAVRRGRGAEIEDIAQEVFLRLLKDDHRLLRAFNPSRARLATYLAVITRTVVYERQRRRSLPMARDADPSWVADRGAETVMRERDIAEATRSLPLEALSEQQRTVLVLMHRQGLSVDEVAQRLGVAAQTVRSAHHKAVSRLRDLLGVRPITDRVRGPHAGGDAATT